MKHIVTQALHRAEAWIFANPKYVRAAVFIIRRYLQRVYRICKCKPILTTYFRKNIHLFNYIIKFVKALVA